MKKKLFLFILILNMVISHAQKFSITGEIINSEKKPIENATVYLFKQKDSSVINYTSTSKDGKFSLKINELKEPLILKIDAEKLIPYAKKFEKIDQSISLGKIELDKNLIYDIEEVKITVSPVKIKKDTIEFNAKAIKVRPDSNIEELLKNISGVEIDNDGKITANGKEVDQIMINGKPFFDKDGKIALKNIPADIIKNIQFTTTKTKEEELSGKPPKSENTTINFNIDEKKNKGFISKLTAGFGSDKRYEANGFLSYFKNKTKISLLASSNNINSQGFSNDGTGNGSRNTQGRNTTNGLHRSTTTALNYNDQWSKNVDLDALGITRSDNHAETRSKVSRTTLLPDFTLKTNSENSGENENEQYKFNSSIKIKPDTLSTIYFSPSFFHSQTVSIGNSKSSTFRDDNLLNESTSHTSSNSQSNNFSPNIHFSRRFKKKGRTLYASINTSISEFKSNSFVNSQTIFYQSTDPNDIRNQLTINKRQNNNFSFTAKYSEPVSDSMSVNLSLNYDSQSALNLRNVNDFNENTGQYSDYNIILSNRSDQKNNQFSPQLMFEINKKKLNLWASLNLDLSDISLVSVFNGEQYNLHRNFALPGYNFGLQYKLSEGLRLSIHNSADFTIPSPERLIPYTDLSNPLTTYKGNPDLKNAWQNKTNIYLNNFNVLKNINYYINFGFTYNNNDTTSFSYFDESGKQFITYTNISGNKTANLSGGFSKTFKWDGNKLTINPRTSLSYRYNKGFINGQQFSGNSYSFHPAIQLTYDLRDKMIIKPSYSIGYSLSKYKNYSIESIQNTNQSFKLELTNYFLQTNLFFGNDFEYNTSSNIAPGFKRDFYFWNTSLGYTFYKKQFTAGIKIYDVLNQNQSVKRTITSSYVEDREDLILKRYIMFSLTMKLNRFTGKKM